MTPHKNPTMKTILVAVDFSPASKNAFQYAVRLARPFGAKVVLLHVYSAGELDPFVPISMQQAMIEAQESVAMEYFTSLEKEVPKDVLKDIELDFQIVIGPAGEQILFYSQDIEPDLIVMGMRGGNIFAQKVLGNTSTHVIQRSKYPIVVVPESFAYREIKRIGYATNFQQEDIQAISKVQEFAARFDADIHCIHIRQNGNIEDEYKLEILKSAYRHEFPLDHIDFETLKYEDVIRGLNSYVENRNLDLLVMLTHNRGLFSQLFHKSMTKQMILQSQVPLWVFQMGSESFEQPSEEVPVSNGK
jgi:nucleotide-binding universal stress UspA family protein